VAINSRHVSVVIRRSPRDVYEFAVDPGNLPQWAGGLAGAEVTQDGERWWTDSPTGRVSFMFAERNGLGVLDHDVTLPDGKVVHNPMRVLSHPDGAEVVFTLRQLTEVSDADFKRDAVMVADDLARLKALLEARS
jgi:uncharacterized protein YndB with AHSA1/START domain